MSKFKQGDWVRVRHLLAKNQISRITRVEENGYWVSNTFWVGNIFCTERNFEPIDPTTAFLNELQALMRKYDVAFGDYEQYRVWMRIGNDLFAWETHKLDEITPDNIFDYEK